MSETTDVHPLATVPRVTPLDILAQAVQRGTSPSELKELMDLAERWRAIEAEEAYAKDMAACQAEMPVLPRSKEGQNNSYAPYEAIDPLIRPIYTRHGFSLSFSEDPTKSTPVAMWMVCKCVHKQGGKGFSEGVFPRDGEGPKGGKISMNAIQAVGSTRSYAKRYLAKDMFALAEADEDDDGQGSGGEPLSDYQAQQLLAFMQHVGFEDKVGLCNFLQIETLDDVTVELLPKAMESIRHWAKRWVPEKLASWKPGNGNGGGK